jgi:hypothetical protein
VSRAEEMARELLNLGREPTKEEYADIGYAASKEEVERMTEEERKAMLPHSPFLRATLARMESEEAAGT